MTLPKIITPIYDVLLPSQNRKIKIRPFLVKEEKILLMAAQSKDPNDISNAMIEVIKNCIQDKSINVDSLPFFDIDYLIIALRAKSVGETVKVSFTCNTETSEGNRCGHNFPVELDISKVKIKKDETISDQIMISEGVGVKLKYPKYNRIKNTREKIETLGETIEEKLDLIKASIDYIFDNETMHSSRDISKEEMDEFLQSMTRAQFEKLEEWVDNFPYFEIDIEHTCEKCGTKHKTSYNDIESFFL